MKTKFSNTVVRKVLMPMVAGAMLVSGTAMAQSSLTDVVGIYLPTLGYTSSLTNGVQAIPGNKIEFTVRLAGTWTLTNYFGTVNYKSIYMRVNTGKDPERDVGQAYLKTINIQPDGLGNPPESGLGRPWARTDLTFEYEIRPGDIVEKFDLLLLGDKKFWVAGFENDMWVKAQTNSSGVFIGFAPAKPELIAPGWGYSQDPARYHPSVARSWQDNH